METTAPNLQEIETKLYDANYAYLETRKNWLHSFWVVFEAHKRNIHVLPMDSLPFVSASLRLFSSERVDLKELVDSHMKREEKFVENIENQGNPRKRNFVILGANHALPLEKTLLQRGNEVKVDLSMFSKHNRSDLEATMRGELRFREAVARGDFSEAWRILRNVNEIGGRIHARKDKLGKGPIALLERIKELNEKRRQRYARRTR